VLPLSACLYCTHSLCFIPKFTSLLPVQVHLDSEGNIIRGTLTKTASGREDRNFPRSRRWMMSDWVKTDSLNCDTETGNRTLQSGSLTVPEDGYKINFKNTVIIL
jgi:hypothetical protein